MIPAWALALALAPAAFSRSVEAVVVPAVPSEVSTSRLAPATKVSGINGVQPVSVRAGARALPLLAPSAMSTQPGVIEAPSAVVEGARQGLEGGLQQALEDVEEGKSSLKGPGSVNFDNAADLKKLLDEDGSAIDRLQRLVPIDVEKEKAAAKVEGLKGVKFVSLWDWIKQPPVEDRTMNVALGSFTDGPGLYLEAVRLSRYSDWSMAHDHFLGEPGTLAKSTELMKTLLTTPGVNVAVLLTSRKTIKQETGNELEVLRKFQGDKSHVTIVVGDLGGLPQEKLDAVHELLRQHARSRGSMKRRTQSY